MSLMEQDRPPGRTRRRFTKEFKADAVKWVGFFSPSGTLFFEPFKQARTLKVSTRHNSQAEGDGAESSRTARCPRCGSGG